MVRPPYRACVRLCQAAAVVWPALDAAYPGIDLLDLPFHRFLNYTHTYLRSVVKPEDWERFEATLADPLDGEDTATVRVSESTLESEQRDFMAMMQMQGMVEGG